MGNNLKSSQQEILLNTFCLKNPQRYLNYAGVKRVFKKKYVFNFTKNLSVLEQVEDKEY